VNVTEVTTAAGWVAGLAIVALIATGWRQTARATADPARARRPDRAPTGLEVKGVEAPLYHGTHWIRRLWALATGSVLAVALAAVTATVVGFGTAYLVITLTSMLKR